MRTSKSPRTVAVTAWHIGQRSLPAYAHRFAPRTFTQSQLFACLTLKAFFNTDYRGITAILHDTPALCEAIELQRVPHFTTLHKAAQRLLRFPVVRRLLHASFQRLMKRRTRVRRAAADSSGFESSNISPYFIRRRSQKSAANKAFLTRSFTRFPKCAVICDCATHLILAVRPTRGPTPDVAELADLQRQLIPNVTIHHLLADAGYDSESNHRLLRDLLGVRSYIPPWHGRPSTKPATGHYRRLMQRVFRDPARVGYGQRWQVETVMSMLKRNLGCAVTGRSFRSQCRDLLLKTVTHNVMIVPQADLFDKAGGSPFIWGGLSLVWCHATFSSGTAWGLRLSCPESGQRADGAVREAGRLCGV